jgi:glutaminase
LAQVGSRRQRSKRQRARLDGIGHRARVYDLAGDLGFAGIEVATRRVAIDAADLDVAVLDLSRVTRVDDVAVSILADLIVDLDAHGKQLALVAAAEHPRLLRRLEEVLAASEGAARLVTFPDTDRALEWCERQLLASDPTPAAEAALPLDGHDLTRDFTVAELASFAAMLTAQRFEPGGLMLRQGDPPDGLYLLLHGEASVTIDLPSGRRKRLATVSPGMSVGELAVVDRSPRSADVHADTAVECAVLSLEAFDRMSATHPSVKIKLLTNLLRAAAQRVFRLNEEAAALAS